MTTQWRLVLVTKLIHSTDCCRLFPVQPGYLYYYKMLRQFTHHISVTAHERGDIYRNIWYHAPWNISHAMVYTTTPIDKRLHTGTKKATGGIVSKYLHKEFSFCITENTTPLHEDRLRHVYTQMNDRNTKTKCAKCKRGGGVHCYHWQNKFFRVIRKTVTVRAGHKQRAGHKHAQSMTENAWVYIQDVPGGRDKTSGECSLC